MHPFEVIAQADKAIQHFPGWSKPDDEDDWSYFLAPIAIGDIVEAGLFLKGGAFVHVPDRNVSLEVILLTHGGARTTKIMRKGLNIDANPEAISAFQKERPDDISVHLAIAPSSGTVDLAFFGAHASSNTTSDTFAKEIERGQGVVIERSISVRSMPTNKVLSEYLPAGQIIDFWNIGIEGLDLVALQTNDWHNVRPRVIAVEDFDFVIDGPPSAIHQLLSKVGYDGISRYQYTTFYVDPAQEAGLRGLPRHI